jgi:hypothetical protein
MKIIQPICLILALTTLLFFATQPIGFSINIPQQISYQGKLMENGVPVNGTKTFTFAFVDTDWSEIHENINVVNGIYSVVLGNITEIPSHIFENNTQTKMNITVDDTELAPDVDILSVGYAFVAHKAEYAEKFINNSIYVHENMNIGLGIENPKEKLDVNGAIKIGSTQESNPGTIRYINGSFQGYDGEIWLPFSQNDNNSFIYAIAGENINGKEMPVPVYKDKNGLVLSQEEGSQYKNIYGVNRFSQSFSTDKSMSKISTISIKLKQIGNPSGDILLSIHELDINGKPNFSPLEVASRNAEIISEEGWYDFSFENEASIQYSSKYVFIVSLPQGTENNYVQWCFASSNRYESGDSFESSDYGTTWLNHSDYDFTFKIHGNHRVFKCMANNQDRIDIIGFAITDAAIGEEVKIQINGIVSGFQELKPGMKYYLANNGSITETAGDFTKLVGIATSENDLKIFWADRIDYATYEEAIEGKSDNKIMTPLRTKQVLMSINDMFFRKIIAGEYINGQQTPVPVFICYGRSEMEGTMTREKTMDFKSAAYDIPNSSVKSQGFTTQETTNRLCGADIAMKKSDVGEVYVTCKITDKNSNILGQKTINLSSSQVYAFFEFKPAIVVEPNTKYWLNFTSRGCRYTIRCVDSNHNNFAYTTYEYHYPLKKTQLYISKADDIDKKYFHGFAISKGNIGNDITVQFNGIVKGFIDLLPGNLYYVQNDGSIGINSGSNRILVGRAITETEIQIIISGE